MSSRARESNPAWPYSRDSVCSKMAMEATLVRPGMDPPSINVTPNSPTVWAKTSAAEARQSTHGVGQDDVAKRLEMGHARAAGRLDDAGVDLLEGRAHGQHPEGQAVDQRAV